MMAPNFTPIFVMAFIGVAAAPLAIWKLVEIGVWLFS